MRLRSYRSEIKKMTAQFMRLFSNIVIDRRLDNGTVQKVFTVPCVLGNRSRVLKSLENVNKTVALPLICVSSGGLDRDSDRVFSIHDGKLYGTGTNSFVKNMPVPINISFDVTIITKFQQDMDMILGNFVPWCIPDLFVVIPNPTNTSEKLKLQVVWNGNINLQPASEPTANTPARIIATTSFIVKGWLFQGLDGIDFAGHYIHRINFNGRMIEDATSGTRLMGWFALDNTMDFTEFQSNFICGYIDTKLFSDQLQITGGHISGYWQDISGLITGNNIGDIGLSGDLMWLTTSDGYVLLLTEQPYVPGGMTGITLNDYIDYYYSTLTGELSGYQGII